MTGVTFPILTTIVFLPAAGALALLAIDTDGGRRDGAVRWAALAVSLLVFAGTLLVWAVFDPLLGGLPARGAARVDRTVRDRVPRGCRRRQPVPGRADRLPDAARAPVVVGRRPAPRQGVLGADAAARERDDRRLRLDRSLPVLRVLGRDAGADVLPDRRLGLRPPHLRRREVLALHDGRKRADAGGHPLARLPARRGDRAVQLQPHRPRRAQHPRQAPVLVLPRLHGGLRHQGAAVPLPHVASRRPRRGAHGRVGDPRRRAAQDGHVRPGALFVPALPRSGRRRSHRTWPRWRSSGSSTARSWPWCSPTSRN